MGVSGAKTKELLLRCHKRAGSGCVHFQFGSPVKQRSPLDDSIKRASNPPIDG
jgi:hypothetical protein